MTPEQFLEALQIATKPVVREYVVVFAHRMNNGIRVRAYSRSEAIEQWRDYFKHETLIKCIPFEPDRHGDFDTRWAPMEWDAKRDCFQAKLP